MLQNKEYLEFLVGRNGDFDQLVSSAIRRCKREIRNNNSSHVWVLPYVTVDYRDYEDDYRAYYDEIEVFSSAGSYYKAAFQARNRSMVDRSHLVVFFVERKEGGAYQTMRYAIQQGKDYSFLSAVLDGERMEFAKLLFCETLSTLISTLKTATHYAPAVTKMNNYWII